MPRKYPTNVPREIKSVIQEHHEYHGDKVLKIKRFWVPIDDYFSDRYVVRVINGTRETSLIEIICHDANNKPYVEEEYWFPAEREDDEVSDYIRGYYEHKSEEDAYKALPDDIKEKYDADEAEEFEELIANPEVDYAGNLL